MASVSAAIKINGGVHVFQTKSREMSMVVVPCEIVRRLVYINWGHRNGLYPREAAVFNSFSKGVCNYLMLKNAIIKDGDGYLSCGCVLSDFTLGELRQLAGTAYQEVESFLGQLHTRIDSYPDEIAIFKAYCQRRGIPLSAEFDRDQFRLSIYGTREGSYGTSIPDVSSASGLRGDVALAILQYLEENGGADLLPATLDGTIALLRNLWLSLERTCNSRMHAVTDADIISYARAINTVLKRQNTPMRVYFS